MLGVNYGNGAAIQPDDPWWCADLAVCGGDVSKWWSVTGEHPPYAAVQYGGPFVKGYREATKSKSA